jgi:hypothetical protein
MCSWSPVQGTILRYEAPIFKEGNYSDPSKMRQQTGVFMPRYHRLKLENEFFEEKH